MAETSTVELATELTVAWLSNLSTRATADEVQTFLQSMSDTIGGLASTAPTPEERNTAEPEYAPAVSVRKSLGSRDYIVSMIDGRPYRTLKRHLATNGLTPAEYRARFKLKADYPMVAPGYSESRRETAKRLGLGRKPAEPASTASEPVTTEPAPKATQPAASTRKPRARKVAADAPPAASELTSSQSAAEQAEQIAAPTPKSRVRKSASEAKAAAKRHLGS